MKRSFKKKAVLPLLSMSFLGIGMLSACLYLPDANLTDAALTGTVIADFTQGEADAVFASDGWTNGSVFNTWWTADNVSYENETMKLTITENENGSEETNNEYFGGEARTYQYFGYGDYEVSMKPAKKAGTASTFFTCTGSYDTDADGNPNPWDEIDIEFLGGDTTKVQFNYFANGAGGHEYMYDLGFDASEEFHTYGYRWTEEYIVWFVDGKPVHKVLATDSNPLPTTAGRILMNYWCGTSDAESWMGTYENPGDEGAQYQWIKTSAAVASGEIPEKVETEEFEGDWSSETAITPSFSASQNNGSVLYNVTADGTSTRVTYASAGNWDNINTDITEAATDKNWIHLLITNNSTVNTPVIRINVRGNNSTINAFGYGNGELLKTNVGEGTFVEPAPGETVEVEIKYTGTATALEIMMDSLQASVVEKDGDITISDIKFAKQGDIETPEEPESVNNGITINGTNVVFGGNTGGDLYIINTDETTNSMNVTYNAIAGGSYYNISAGIADIASDKNVYETSVTNNGSETVTLRVDIVSKTQVNENTKVCNLSATQDGVEVYTDLTWGGSTFTIEAGKTAAIAVTYDTKMGPESVQLMLDSSVYGDTLTHSGDVTFTNMAFTGEYVDDGGDAGEEEGSLIPEDAVNQSLSFASNDVYTVTPSETPSQSVTVTYTDIGGQSYRNITADISQVASDKTSFAVKILNNGEAQSRVRFDLLGANNTAPEGSNTAATNVSAVTSDGTSLYTDLSWGGSFVEVDAGSEVIVIITYDNSNEVRGAASLLNVFLDSSRNDANTYSGNITLSEFKFW